MYPLIFVIIALLVVALYPIVRDFIRQRRITTPAYVEGLQLLLEGKLKEAAVKFKTAVEDDTGNVDAYIRLGNIFFAEGDVERALRIHESLALRRNLKPEEERKVYQALVQDYLKTNRPVKAIPLLEELIRLDRNDIPSQETLLDLLIANGSWDKGEELLKEMGHKHPERISRLYAIFGYAYGKINPQKGSHWLEEAVRLKPNSSVALVLLGDLFLSQGEGDNAIKIWHRLLETAPEKNYLVRERLERAYYELGRYEEVVQIYRRLLQKVPQDSGLAIALAKIYAKKEDWEEAITLLTSFAKGGEPVVLLTLASFLLKKGETAQVQVLLDKVIAKLVEKSRTCPKCGKPLPETEIRCPECRTWLDDIK